MRPFFFKTWLAFCLILPVTAHALDREQRLPMGPSGNSAQPQASVATTAPNSTSKSETSESPAVQTPEKRREKTKTAKADTKPSGKGKTVAKADTKHPAKTKTVAKADTKAKTVTKADAKAKTVAKPEAKEAVAEAEDTQVQAPAEAEKPTGKHTTKNTKTVAKTKATGKKPVKGATALASNKQTSTKQSTKVVNRAVKALGTPYRWGGTSPTNGFDCSGFVKYAFNGVKAVSLPHNSGAMAAGRGQKVSKGDLKPGDLLFFNTEGRKVDHVAIYLGDDKFIHAPREGKNVSIDNLKTPYWQSHYVLAKRVLPKDKSMVVQR